MAAVRIIAGRFEVEAVAGTGGMGVVYRARDREAEPGASGSVALKVVHGRSQQGLERFEREARTLSELRHPAIVRYIAHGTSPQGELWLAMEWLEGEDLEERLARGRLPIGECVELGGRVAAALAVAHAAGIVHRDIKPSNLFLPSGAIEEVKVLDFGIARAGGPLAARTKSGVILGTPGYMAPEQARGERSLDARADVFALGSVLFECITGQAAFAGEHLMAILTKILFEDTLRVSELRGGVPAALDSLVARMLAKQPADRPADGSALETALRRLDPAGTIDEAPTPQPTGERSITGRELCLLSLVLARDDPRSSEPIDPDQTARMLLAEGAPEVEEIRTALAPYGGRLETLADGCLVVALRGRGTATDAAAQAARCALTLRALIPRAAMALVTGLGELQGQRLVGEAIDRGARLVRSVEPSELGPPPVLLDEVTSGLLDARFEVGPDRLLVGELPETESPRTLMGKSTPCVGRDREIATLVGLFESTVNEPQAHAVLVTGAAGVGKSRLRLEALSRLRATSGDLVAWLGRGDPIRAGSPLALLADVVRRACGVRQGDPLLVQRRALEARVARVVPAGEAPRVAEFLGEMVGVPFPDQASVQLRAARHDAALMGSQIQRAWETFVSAQCAAGPLVLALEDVHWADPPSLRAVGATLRALADRPLLVLAFGRPESEEQVSRAWSERPLDHLRLAGLNRRAAEALAQCMLGSAVATEVVNEVVEHSAGNAFFLEELIRAQATGAVRTAPATVLAMIRGRLDALDAGARRALRAASIFGRTFWRGGVAAIIGGDGEADLDAVLSDLAEREVVARRRSERFPGQSEWTFRHDLAREAAYGMLTEADRAVGHGLAGDWLERLGERDAVTLAEHFERGGNAARALRWYVTAADDALRASDLGAVIDRAERAVSLGAAGETLGAVRALEAEAYRSLDQNELGRKAGLEALRHLPPESRRRYSAAGALATALGRLGRHDALVALAEELLEPAPAEAAVEHVSAAARAAISLLFAGRYAVAEALLRQIEQLDPAVAEREPTVRAWIHVVRATRAQFAGDLGALAAEEEAAANAYEASGNVRSALEERTSLGWACVLLGAYERAESVLRETLAAGRRLGIPQVELGARENLGLVLALQGRLEEALPLQEEALRGFAAHQYRRMEGGTQSELARTHLWRGDLDAAVDCARAGVELLAEAPSLLARGLSILAEVHLARSEGSLAIEPARRAMAILTSLGAVEEGEMFIRLAFARSLEAVGEHEASRAALAEARVRLLTVADRIRDPTLRESFLGRVPENARILALTRG
ncbi:MAG: protein kinase [Deltaproteobacteria bacterium]|nr:protein kinase [Deltaproteobacteria bacterium]